MAFIIQNWMSFGPVEGEDDLQITEPVKQAEEKTKLPGTPIYGDTVWFGDQPAPKFKLKIDEEK